ncbi:MAG TPA: hypothetical protein VE089_04010 [Nitrososphaeraceae archaeon]|jgi:serine/threonine-protein kinase|nr:hypothetical protein [Nitrososphaeraceae archaeon]
MSLKLDQNIFSSLLSRRQPVDILFLLSVISSLTTVFLFYFPGHQQQAIAESIPQSLGSSLPSSHSYQNKTNVHFLTYQNSSDGIGIQYPSNWKKVDHGDNASIPSHTTEFLSPLTANDTFQENVFVKVDPFPQNLRQLVAAEVSGFKTQAVNFMLLNSIPTVVAGNPAQILVFKYSNFLPQFNTLKAMIVLTVKDQKAYAISYVAESPKYSEYLSTVEEMINSFRIIK